MWKSNSLHWKGATSVVGSWSSGKTHGKPSTCASTASFTALKCTLWVCPLSMTSAPPPGRRSTSASAMPPFRCTRVRVGESIRTCAGQ
eukprot:4098276-Pyramimonas_sp.AAC.1